MPRWSTLVLLGFAATLAPACSSSLSGDSTRGEDAAARVPAPDVAKGKNGKSSRKGRARTAPKPPVSAGDVTVRVLPDGSFEPEAVTIKAGAKVTWELSDPYRQSIAPLKGDGGDDPCSSVAPYKGEAGELTGPMPRNPSGLFILNQDGPGLGANGKADPSGAIGGIHDASWSSDGNVGGYLRLRWNWLQPDGEGKYDWTILDREVEKAVSNGKLYTVAVKAGLHGTPSWIFDAGVDKHVFRDFGSHQGTEECKCGAFMELGSPTQRRYQDLYFEMLDAMAEHLQSNAAWYRHLAYIKPSGANLYTAENRLPKRCTCAKQCPGADQVCKVKMEFKDHPGLDASGRICNTKVWADAGYTPEGLYTFYDRQFERIAKAYPEKDMVYMLIHDGFPRVAGPNNYLECGDGKKAKGVPPPVVQTEEILKRGYDAHGDRFVIQHAGVREGKDMNNLLLKARRGQQFIGLQTTNDVLTAAQLDRVVRQGMKQSEHAMFFEVYEEGALEAKGEAKAVNALLHERRKRVAAGNGPRRDPFPETHSYTFGDAHTVHLLNPATCATGEPATAVVYVE